MPRRTSGRLRPRQSAGRYPPPRPSLMLPGTEFIHPISGGASFRPKPPCETEHRQRPRRLPPRRPRVFLPLQPGQQLPGMRLVQLFHLFNDHLNCAHVGSVALVRNVATSALGKVSVSPGGGCAPSSRSFPATSILKGSRHSAQRWTAREKGAAVLHWGNIGEGSPTLLKAVAPAPPTTANPTVTCRLGNRFIFAASRLRC